MCNKFKLGSIDSPSDPRDYTYNDLCMATCSDIPKSYCLDWKAYKILNQGNVGSCKAHALSMIKSYIDGKQFSDRYSVGWIYGNRYDTDWQGHGLISRETLKHLIKEGVVSNCSFPINEEYPQIKSTIDKYGKDKLLSEASNNKSLAYIRLSKDNIKNYLYTYKKPILIDVYVYDNFYEANTNGGYIPSIPKGNKLGGHSMVIIGYDKDELIIVNSWGENVGDKGIFYLDINSPIIKELWALEDKLNINRPKVINYGWEKINPKTPADTVKWKYVKENGNYACNEWIKINSDWFYIGSDELMYEMKWVLYKNKWYFLGENGYMYYSKWCLWKNKWYYLLEDGSMATNQWIGKYYVDENGVWIENK